MHESVQIDDGAGAAIVTLRGELDAHDAPSLRETFAAAVAALAGLGAAPRLVLDLSDVTFLDSTVLGTLVGTLRRVRESSGELLVVLPDPPARRIFEITGLDGILAVRPTQAAALAR